jgi:hypothetical protein
LFVLNRRRPEIESFSINIGKMPPSYIMSSGISNKYLIYCEICREIDAARKNKMLIHIISGREQIYFAKKLGIDKVKSDRLLAREFHSPGFAYHHYFDLAGIRQVFFDFLSDVPGE